MTTVGLAWCFMLIGMACKELWQRDWQQLAMTLVILTIGGATMTTPDMWRLHWSARALPVCEDVGYEVSL